MADGDDEVEIHFSRSESISQDEGATGTGAATDERLVQDLKIEGKPIKGLHMTADFFKWEVLVRSGVQMLLGYILTVAYLPNIIPTSGTYLIGIFASTCAVAVPHTMFTIAAVWPLVIGMFVLILVVTSMHLACVEVSDGLMVAIYSIWSLMGCALYFGPGYQSMSGLSALVVGMPGMMIVSFLPLIESDIVNVTDLWTQSGLENPGAAMRNTLILVCWAVLVMVVGVLLPPWRTARSLLSKHALPPALTGIMGYLKMTEKPENNDEIVSRTIHLLSLLHGKAGVTKFEPRIWRNEDLFTPLNNLLQKFEILGEYAILKFVDTVPGGEPSLETHQLLSLSAQALFSNDVDDYAALKNYDGLTTGTAEFNNRSVLTQMTFERAKDVRDATLTWLKALNGGTSAMSEDPKVRWETSLLNLKTITSWFLIPIFPVAKILSIVALPFQPNRWNFMAALWALELALGYILLLIISVYSSRWTDLGIGTDASYYSGWHLLGYAYSLRPTSGGTFKKGLARELGTIVGGFAAWLGAIVCAGTYDQSAELNPYGVVAWLIVTNIVAIYFVTFSGPKAYFGPIPDNQFPIMYFVMTNSLILLEVQDGSGDRDAILVNRIIATASGVVMAILITSLPPQIKGYDPDRVQHYYDSLKSSLIDLLENLILCDADQDFQKNHAKLNDAKWLGDREVFYAKDVDLLSWLPVYRLHPDFIPLLEQLNITGVFIDALIRSAEKAIKEDKLFFRDHQELLTNVVNTLKESTLPEDLQEPPKLEKILASEASGAMVDSLKTLLYRFKQHQAVMEHIRTESNLSRRVLATFTPDNTSRYMQYGTLILVKVQSIYGSST